jgi:hypothetical protein
MAKLQFTLIAFEGDDESVRALANVVTRALGSPVAVSGSLESVALAPLVLASIPSPAPPQATPELERKPVSTPSKKNRAASTPPVEPAKPSMSTRSRGTVKVQRVSAPPPEAGVADEEAKPEPGCRGQVLARLKVGPRTTQDLCVACKPYTSASVYLALKNLRDAKAVKTEVIDGVAQNVWMETE